MKEFEHLILHLKIFRKYALWIQMSSCTILLTKINIKIWLYCQCLMS